MIAHACAKADACMFAGDCENYLVCAQLAEEEYEENLLDEAIADEVWGRSQPTEET